MTNYHIPWLGNGRWYTTTTGNYHEMVVEMVVEEEYIRTLISLYLALLVLVPRVQYQLFT